MQRFMLGLDRAIRRRPRAFVGAWLVLLAAAVPFAMRQSDHLTGGGFGVPGSQAARVLEAQARAFPGGARTTLGVVLAPGSAANGPALTAALTHAERILSHTRGVTVVPAAARAAAAQAAAGRTVVLALPLRSSADASIDLAAKLRTALRVGTTSSSGITTHLIGQGALWAGMQDLSKRDLKGAETTGFPIVLLILLAVFGSLAAAALPLALGAVSVAVTGGLIYWLSQAMEMSVFVTNMASMIGIGVAVDYSLFVLSRYREEIAAGRSPAAARATALATSGVAVVFSGMTVVVSLAGLWMIDNAAIRSMALGAMLVVAVSVLAASTLLPALIALLGRRAAGHGRAYTILRLAARSWAPRRRGSTRPIASAGAAASGASRFWLRWTAAVTRRPAVTAAATAAVLLTLAIPTLSLHMGAGALHQFPPGNETRAGFEAAAKVIGPGATSPVEVLVTAPDAATLRHVVPVLESTVARDAVTQRIAGVRFSGDRRNALIEAIPRVEGESNAAKAMVARLRVQLPAQAGSGVSVAVGGVSAQQADLANLISGSMWKILLFVLALSYLVLLVLLRSVLLPLKAVVMNLLSVGAAYGVLVAVFQWGWLAGPLGVHPGGRLDALTPPLVLAVVFGLSMDYEVFLLTRVRERFKATGDPRRAVAEGLAASARTITSAALIMASVFLVFVGTSVPSIQQLGLGNAVAVLIDATLVRLVLVPATMELLGRWNWWLPRPLARLLPRVSHETAPATA